ncbi:unnamed protein product [Withania somnifera]
MAFSWKLLQHSLWSKSEFLRTLSIPPLNVNHELVVEVPQQKLKIQGIKSKSHCLGTLSMLNPQSGTSMFSPSDTIKKFYSSINNKDMNQLGYIKLMQEALEFLGKLTICMGKKTEFCIEHIYEGVDLTIVVNWHLEWNKKEVPFTRGCSCYELSRDGEELVIRKAQVIVESPIKPGSLALEAFQKVISVCDAFPETTEWLLLMSPHLLLSIYHIVLLPSVRPILACCCKLWSITVSILTLIYAIFLFIVEKFHN